jgi:photoprotection regulator FRP-like protein
MIDGDGNRGSAMNDRPWSASEKKIARRAYEMARQVALAGTLAEFKANAAAVTTVDDMWSIVDRLHQRRRELQELLDYRYSQFPLVFARLILEGHLDEKELAGLAEDKLEEIRRSISFVRNA